MTGITCAKTWRYIIAFFVQFFITGKFFKIIRDLIEDKTEAGRR